MTDAPAAAPDTRAARANEEILLQARKQDLYAAMRALARDHEEGTIDEVAYRQTLDRYEREAAGILERLDTLSPEQARPAAGWRLSVPAALGAVALIAAAIVIILIAALRDRGAGTITGSQPGFAPTAAPAAAAVPPPVAAALRAERRNPRSAAAWLALGNAYLDSGASAGADGAFQTAQRLAPGQPEAPTLDSLALAAEGKITVALQVLTGVERAHPTYARAWLTDGLIASRRAPGIPRAIRAWKRFLVLQPHSAISAEVRASLLKLEATQRGPR